MAEAITYADLRFVKAPLMKSISSRLEQDTEDYEDGELTYENVQVPPIPAEVPAMASSGLGDTARVKAEQPAKSWSCRQLSAGRVLPCPTSTSCLQYLLIGLLLICLLSGVAALCLGVRYLQLSQQFQQMTRVLKATNSSLRQQVHQSITELGHQEEELQKCKSNLATAQKKLQEEESAHTVTEGQLEACQLDGKKTKETLKREEEERRALDQRLNRMWDRLKSSSTCPTLDSCCPLGWKPYKRSCFYFSYTKKTWEESRNYCTSLSSNLAIFHEDSSSSIYDFLPTESLYPYWQWWTGSTHSLTQHSWPTYSKTCSKVQIWKRPQIQQGTCTDSLFFICEREVFRFSDEDRA